MKNTKAPLHILLSLASLLGFLGGWATLAHSRKPNQNTGSNPSIQALEPLPDLAPLPALSAGSASSSVGSGLVIISPQTLPSRRPSRPVFSTSGS